MFVISADPEVHRAVERARAERSGAFWSLFRRTRPNRVAHRRGYGKAAA